MQSCDSTCRQCFHAWVKWYKSRMHQMAMPHKGGVFAEAAATSVRPPRHPEGSRVRVKSVVYPHTATVLRNSGERAGDGVYRVYVAVVSYKCTWHVHVPREDLEDVTQ